MAAILSITKTIVIEDNTGNRWNLTINGDFDAHVSTAATFEDNEIKDLCSIRITDGEYTVARFLIYENADTSRGYIISGIPGTQIDGSHREIVLTPANANLGTPYRISYSRELERIKVR